MSTNYNHLTAYFRIYHKKSDNTPFPKMNIKGKYIPKNYITHNNPIEEDQYYSIKLKEFPKDEGKYTIFFESGNAWIDEREAYLDKHILRIKGEIKFEKLAKLKDKKSDLGDEEDTLPVAD